MKAAQLIQQSFRSLLLHRLRALLSCLGVLFGVAAVVAMGAIGEGAKRQALAQIEQLGTHTVILRTIGEEEEGLLWSDVQVLEQGLPTLSHLAPVAADPFPADFEVLATTPDFGLIRRLALSEGRLLCEADVQQRRLVCVLGTDLARALGGRHVGDTVRLGNEAYTVVGLLRPTQWQASEQPALATRNLNELLLIPLFSAPTLSEVILQVRDGGQIEKTALAATYLLGLEHRPGVQVVVPHSLLAQAQKTQATFTLVLGSIAAISLLVGGIGIANIMLANVTERRREIGIRRALGATRTHIALQFLCEATILTLLGGLSGLSVGCGMAYAIAKLAGWPVAISFFISSFAIGTSVVTGLCAGLSPALRAAKQNPVSALALH